MPLFCGDIKICCAFRTFWKTFSRGGGVTKTPCVTSGTLLHKERFHEKVAVLLDFVQMRGGGEGPAQIFCHIFISAFLANKRSPKCQ